MKKINNISEMNVNEISTYELNSGKIIETEINLTFEKTKKILIEKALNENEKSISIFEKNSFSILEDKLYFWFNDESNSTKCLVEKIIY